MLVSKVMKKYIFKILVFFSIVALLDITFGLICKYMVKHSPSALTTNLLHKQYGAMIMGSSRCLYHYDDKLMSDTLGLDVLNAGEEGYGVILMYGRYHVIPDSIKPLILVYDVEPSFDVNVYENDDDNRRYLEGLKPIYDEDGIKDIFIEIDKWEVLKMSSQFYRNNSLFFTIVQNYLKQSNLRFSRYSPLHKEYSEPGVGPQKERGFDSVKLHYFERLIMECKEHGTKLVVVASPKYGAISKRDLQPVMEICELYDIPFWDYYYDMHETRWFGDNMHLNYNGSQEFTKKICRRIQEEIINK